MKNKDIENLYMGLLEFQSIKDIYIPIKVGYAVVHNTQVLQPILLQLIEKRREFINQYAKPDPAPGEPDRFFVEEKDRDFVEKELNSLDDTDTPVDIIKLKIDDFKDIKLPISTIASLMSMISEED